MPVCSCMWLPWGRPKHSTSMDVTSLCQYSSEMLGLGEWRSQMMLQLLWEDWYLLWMLQHSQISKNQKAGNVELNIKTAWPESNVRGTQQSNFGVAELELWNYLDSYEGQFFVMVAWNVAAERVSVEAAHLNVLATWVRASLVPRPRIWRAGSLVVASY